MRSHRRLMSPVGVERRTLYRCPRCSVLSGVDEWGKEFWPKKEEMVAAELAGTVKYGACPVCRKCSEVGISHSSKDCKRIYMRTKSRD
jgi:hypothetical protein